MQKRIHRRILSFVLSLCLLIGGLGASPVEIQAEGESATGAVIYVGGTGASDDNDGQTVDTPVETLKAAYEKVPPNNVKSTIVVRSELTLAPEKASTEDGWAETDLAYAGGTIRGTTNSAYYDCYDFPTHTGEVVITST